MGNAFDEILDGLNEINEILSIVNAIVPFHEDSLNTYKLIEKSIHLQISSTSELDQTVDAVARLQISLNNLQLLIKKLILAHFDNHIIPLSHELSPICITSQSPLAEFKTLADSLAHQIKAQNARHVTTLQLLRKKISSKAPPALCTDVDDLLTTLKTWPTQPVAAELISDLEKRAQAYKKPTRTWNIEPLIEGNHEQSPLHQAIEEQQQHLNDLSDNHRTLSQHTFHPNTEQDFMLSAWINDYNEKTKEAETEKVFIGGKLKTTLEHSGYHEILLSQLKNANTLLRSSNQHRKALLEKIRPREALLYPSDDDPAVLDQLLLNAKTELKTQFEQFLLHFSIMDASSKVDKDTQLSLQNLLQFTHELKQKFHDQPDIVNSNAIADWHDRLLAHLGEKKSFGWWSAPPVKMKPDDITDLSNKLFDVKRPSSFSSAVHKKQIVLSYTLAATIQQFDIQPIKNYQIFKTLNKSSDEAIQKAIESTLTGITALENQIVEYLNFLPKESGNRTLTDAEQVQVQLQSLRVGINHDMEDYDRNRETLSKETSSLAREDKLSSLQQERIEKISNNALALEAYQKQAAPLIQMLQLQFNQRKNNLKSSLDDTLIHARAVNEFITSHGSLKLNIETAEFETKLSEAEGLLKTVDLYKNHIDTLRENIDTAIQQLNRHSTIIIQALRDCITPMHKAAEQSYQSKRLPSLHPDNPLQSDIKAAFEDSLLTLRELDHAVKDMDTLQGSGIEQWYKNWTERLNKFEHSLESRRNVQVRAEEIQRRLNTSCYAASRDILKKLDSEFARLTKKYIEPALHKVGNDAVAAKLKTLQSKPGLPIEPCEKDLLNRVDPRLYTLATMHQEFTQINKRYINPDTRLSSDHHYFDKLSQSVKRHFKNPNMEALSDGVRHKWVQFIRINVVKPLQKLSFNLGNYLKHQNHDAFFVTLGACRTEKELAELGHDLSKRLVSPAA